MLKTMIAALAFSAVTCFAQTQNSPVLKPDQVKQTQNSPVMKLDQVNWQPTGLAGAEMALLWGDDAKGTAVWAFRLQPGVAIPPHTHSKDYWGFAIQGRWEHIDGKGRTEVTAQDAYVRIRANELHGDRCVGPEPCINIIQFDGQRDIHFPADR